MSKLRSVRALALAALAAACGEPDAPPAETSPPPANQPPPFVPPPTFANDVESEWFAEPPGERAPVAGIDGFHAISALEFADLPGVPQRFDFVYVFPDRARWSIVPHLQPEVGFILDYQYGGHRYRKAAGSPVSVEQTGASLHAGLRQMKLRLALMMYPDALEWEPEEERGGETTRTTRLGDEVGAIRVTLGEDGRPTAFTAVDASGEDQETLRVDGWQEIEGRRWPRDVRLEAEGRLVWTEQVKELTTRVNLSDRYFIPVDFKELPEVRRDFDAQPQIIALPPMAVRSEELPEGADWTSALAAEAEHRERRSAEGDVPPLDPFVSFTLDDEARPTGFFVRLEPGSPPTEGYTSRPQRRAVSLFVRSLEQLTADHVAALRATLPAGASALEPYVTWPGEEAERQRVQLVLPFD